MAAATGGDDDVERILKGLESYFKDVEDLKRLAPAFIADYRKKVEEYKAEGKLGSVEHLELEDRKSKLISCANKMNADMEATTAYVKKEVERLEREEEEYQDQLRQQQQRIS